MYTVLYLHYHILGTFIFCICIAVLYLSNCFKNLSSCTILQVTKSLEEMLLGQVLGPQMWQWACSGTFICLDRFGRWWSWRHGDWLGRKIQKLQFTSTKTSVCGSRLLFYKVKEPFPWVEQSGHTPRCMAFYETVCWWLLFRISCPVCYLYVSTIWMCVWVGYRRPSKIICSQKGSTLCQWGVEKTERRCCYAYNQEKIGLALQMTRTGSRGNNSSHQRSNRHVFFWQRKGYHGYTSAEQNINPADMRGAETAHFMHTGRRWPCHSSVHPDWYIEEEWCWAPHLQVCPRVNIIGVIPLTHWSLHSR